MDSGKTLAEPSRTAIWLITLFGPGEAGQASLGDLLEEFSSQRRKMRGPAAKRWFWRQTLRTLVYLVGREIRIAPVTVAVAAIGGFLLRWYVSRSLRPTVTAAIDALLQRFHLYLLDPHAYIFWTIHLVYAERFLFNALVGIAISKVAKEYEIGAVVLLALLGNGLAIVSVWPAVARTGDTGLLWTLPCLDRSLLGGRWRNGENFGIVDDLPADHGQHGIT
jgi:hypothetical protein